MSDIDPMLPVLRDPDGRTYFREWNGGILAGGFEPMGKPIFYDKIPAKFEYQLFAEDWDHFGWLTLLQLMRACGRINGSYKLEAYIYSLFSLNPIMVCTRFVWDTKSHQNQNNSRRRFGAKGTQQYVFPHNKQTKFAILKFWHPNKAGKQHYGIQ